MLPTYSTPNPRKAIPKAPLNSIFPAYLAACCQPTILQTMEEAIPKAPFNSILPAYLAACCQPTVLQTIAKQYPKPLQTPYSQHTWLHVANLQYSKPWKKQYPKPLSIPYYQHTWLHVASLQYSKPLQSNTQSPSKPHIPSTLVCMLPTYSTPNHRKAIPKAPFNSILPAYLAACCQPTVLQTIAKQYPKPLQTPYSQHTWLHVANLRLLLGCMLSTNSTPNHRKAIPKAPPNSIFPGYLAACCQPAVLQTIAKQYPKPLQNSIFPAYLPACCQPTVLKPAQGNTQTSSKTPYSQHTCLHVVNLRYSKPAQSNTQSHSKLHIPRMLCCMLSTYSETSPNPTCPAY